jgi:hypothetical protein
MTKKELAEIYRAHLAEEGYLPKLDNDGDIVFKREGRTYFILLSENDLEFIRVVFAGFWPIEDQDERARALAAAHHATAQTKVAKVFLVEDNVWSAVELFCSPPESGKNVIERSLRAVGGAAETFREAMQ